VAPVVITAKNTVLPEGLLTPRIDIDEVSLTEGRKENPRIDADRRMAAYVMYTSGSTGRPKGGNAPGDRASGHQMRVRGLRHWQLVPQVLLFGFGPSLAQLWNRFWL
jgi:acyl-coenzyme A synthetase/AMP-(fatty) acid ligase